MALLHGVWHNGSVTMGHLCSTGGDSGSKTAISYLARGLLHAVCPLTGQSGERSFSVYRFKQTGGPTSVPIVLCHDSVVGTTNGVGHPRREAQSGCVSWELDSVSRHNPPSGPGSRGVCSYVCLLQLSRRQPWCMGQNCGDTRIMRLAQLVSQLKYWRLVRMGTCPCCRTGLPVYRHKTTGFGRSEWCPVCRTLVAVQ